LVQMSKLRLFSLASAVLAGTGAFGNPLELDLSRQTVKAFDRIEITIPETFDPSNPYDFEEITVDGLFISPGGEQFIMPGFYYQPYKVVDGRIVENGQPVWKVRFMPVTAGEWNGTVGVCHKGKTVESEPFTFVATESSHPGLLRVSQANPYALEYENGEPFFSFGANICDHYPHKELNSFDEVHDSIERVDDMSLLTSKLKEHNAVFPRFRIDDSRMGIEAIECKAGYEGVGRYHQRTSWEIDRCVGDAERQGAKYLFCLYSGANLRPRYDRNIFWKKFGGPVDTTAEIWTSEKCLDYFKRKIRYCVARWGACSGIGAWEIFNEILVGYQIEPDELHEREAFQRKLSAYFKEIDPYKRLVTTNPHGALLGVDRFAGMMDDPNIDLVNYHIYSAEDFAVEVQRLNEYFRDRFRKPIVITEYGASTQLFNQSVHGSAKYDPQGIFLHNGAWASVMTGATGIHPWFLKKHLHPMNLYDETFAVAEFVKEWEYNKAQWEPVDVQVRSKVSGDNQRWGPCIAPRVKMWTSEMLRKGKVQDVYTIRHNGSIEDAGFVNAVLATSSEAERIRFKADYPVAGTFRAHIERVEPGQGGEVHVRLSVDGNLQSEKVFHTDFVAEDAKMNFVHPETIALEAPVAKGEHRIEVRVEGDGRIQVSYEFDNYLDRERANYRAYALGDGAGNIIAWIKNAAHTYSNVYFDRALPVSLPATVHVPVPEDGPYIVEWYDTYGGGMTKVDGHEARGGILTLDWRGTDRDIAVKIRRDTRGSL
jgi:hypothetical protein